MADTRNGGAGAGAMEFQSLDWHAMDLPACSLHPRSVRARAVRTWEGEEEAGGLDEAAEEDVPEEDEVFWARHVFVIHCFGRTADGASVSLRLTKFTPYFFVRPEGVSSITPSLADGIVNAVSERMSPSFRKELRGGQVRSRKEARGFQGGAVHDFLCLFFDSRRAMKHAAFRIREGGACCVITSAGRRSLVTYETTIDPLIRALHVMDLQTAGWIDVNTGKAYSRDARRQAPGMPPDEWATSALRYTLPYSAVSPHSGRLMFKTAPFVVAAYDIEAVGSSENFPIPVKDYSAISDKLAEVLKEAIGPDTDRRLRPSKSELRGIITAYLMMCYGVPPPGGTQASAAVEKYGRTNVLASSNSIRVVLKAPLEAPVLHAICWQTSEDARDVFLNPPVFRGSDARPTEEEAMRDILNAALPKLAGDTLTQVGITVGTVGSPGCTRRWIATLGTCSRLPTAPDAVVVECSSESEVLSAFRDEMCRIDPDVICDYNGSNFDWSFMWGRALELGMASNRRGARERKDARRGRYADSCDDFLRGLSRLNCDAADYVERNLSSSALGDNFIKQLDMPGRIVVDIYREVLKTHKLDSYKLDDVAEKLVGDKKHDMDHREMKRLQNGSADDRALVADYCVQDCALCLKLIHKLKIVPGAMAMASLSRVPLSAIFQRGQGVKTGSLVFYTCRKLRKLMRDMPRPRNPGGDETSYKGATVQKALQGLYDTHPVAVLDFASLYPSVMQSGDKDPDADGRAKAGISYDNIVDDDRYLGLPGYRYHTIEYPIIEGKGDKEREIGIQRCTFARPESDEDHDKDRGVLPIIEKDMLSARKAKRKQMWHRRVVLSDGAVVIGEVKRAPRPEGVAGEAGGGPVEVRDEAGRVHALPEGGVVSEALAYTDAEREVMDCQQLSYKLTANSLYGQLGAKTSEIRDKRLAACVTTVGRNLIQWVVEFSEREGPGLVNRAFSASGRGVSCLWVKVVYGDTDSVFLTIGLATADGAPITGKDAIPHVMAASEVIADAFTAVCARPNVLEPEKTYFPLLLRGKKMYCGNLYPHGEEKYKFSTMGLSTKRRDNAPVSKRAINALLDPIMANFDVEKGLSDLSRVVSELVDGTVDLGDLVLSKTLRGTYKNPHQIPHKVLAERMGRRDSGSKPAINSRVPYVFVEDSQPAGRKRKRLQGDRVEHPDYIRANGIRPDLLYYLETQVAGYAVQILGVFVERLPRYKHPENYWEALEREMRDALSRTDATEAQRERRIRTKIEQQRQDLARDLVFGPVLTAMRLRSERQSLITNFFSKGGA